MLCICVLLSLLVTPVAGGFAEGVLRPSSPPMGWRSWNQFMCDISQDIMQKQVDALFVKRLGCDSKQTSLFDLGYTHVGLDDCWQKCTAKSKGQRQHILRNASGFAEIDTSKFPNMSNMVDYGKKKGALMGFYSDNCRCHETSEKNTHYPQDAHLTEALGFDGIKIDSCGNQRNMTQWARDFTSEGRDLLVESCGNGPAGTNPKKDPVPMPSWVKMLNDTCPFSLYRVSVDVAPQWESVLYNANRAVPYLESLTNPLSRPGCWAYPDMLEVGVKLSYRESRTHFGLWSIISSPLILGFDLNDNETLNKVWDIISNKEVIRVNQAWAGHPGRLIANSSTYFEATCKHGATAARGEPCRLPQWQVWAKPMPAASVVTLPWMKDIRAVPTISSPAEAMALLVVNNANSTSGMVTVPLSSLGFDGSVSVRDLWTHTNNGTSTGALQFNDIPPHDGVMFLLTPTTVAFV